MINNFLKKFGQYGDGIELNDNDTFIDENDTVINVLIHFTPIKTYVYVADRYCFVCEADGVEFEDPKTKTEYTINGNYVCLLLDDSSLTPTEKIKKVLEQYSLTENEVVFIEIFAG
jgi:hypothetical protein